MTLELAIKMIRCIYVIHFVPYKVELPCRWQAILSREYILNFLILNQRAICHSQPVGVRPLVQLVPIALC